MTTFRKSLVYSFAQSYLGLIIQFASTMVLARLLKPEEIGIFSVAVGFIGLAQILREFGVARYIIQEEELTTDRLKAAFTITLCVGWVAALIIMLSAPYLGQFYGHSGVEQVLYLLSVNFFLIPFGAVTFAYLRRNMKFGKLLFIQTSSALVHSGTAIYTAYIGQSYLSLGWAGVTGTLTSVLLTFVVRPKEIPFLPGIKEIKRVLAYGSYASFSSIIQHIGDVAPEWIMGKTLDMSAVGLYSRAQGTIGIFGKLVTSGVNSVISPHFAQAKREKRSMREPYLHAVACISVLAWSFMGFLYVMAEPIFRVLYGDQWDAAIPLLQVWCISYSIYTLTSTVEQIFSVIGKIKSLVKVQAILVIANCIGILYVSVQYGLLAVFYVFIILSVVRTMLVMPMIGRFIGVKLFDYLSVIFKGSFVSILSILSAYLLNFGYLFACNDFLKLAVSGFLFGIIFLLSSFLIKHPLSTEIKNIYFRFL